MHFLQSQYSYALEAGIRGDTSPCQETTASVLYDAITSSTTSALCSANSGDDLVHNAFFTSQVRYFILFCFLSLIPDYHIFFLDNQFIIV